MIVDLFITCVVFSVIVAISSVAIYAVSKVIDLEELSKKIF